MASHRKRQTAQRARKSKKTKRAQPAAAGSGTGRTLPKRSAHEEDVVGTKPVVSWAEFLALAGTTRGAQSVAAFVVRHKTSLHSWAATDALFQLVVVPAAGGRIVLPFPDQKKVNERERGRDDGYVLRITGPLPTLSSVERGSISMAIRNPKAKKGRNAWLPDTIHVYADVVGSDHDVALVARYWPVTKWFSGDSDELLGVPGAQARVSWDLRV